MTEAIRYAVEKAGVDQKSAPFVVTFQAHVGFVSARAIEMRTIDNEGFLDGIREWDVPPEFWTVFEAGDTDWELGNFRGTASVAGKARKVRLDGVHFHHAALALALPETSETGVTEEIPSIEPQTKNSGGRPPAAFSDDLMCAIWSRIYQGGLIPETKAAIKDAILEWASLNGHELSETTAKEKARKIFNAYQREDGNP